MTKTTTTTEEFITEVFCHAAVALLLLIECICWLINELSGFHRHRQPQQQPQRKPKQQPQPPYINPLFTDLQPLTVKQLRTITGLSSRKARRKADLIHALAYC